MKKSIATLLELEVKDYKSGKILKPTLPVNTTDIRIRDFFFYIRIVERFVVAYSFVASCFVEGGV